MVKKVHQIERVDESGGVHAMWSPSSGERWLACPLSVIQSQALPKQKTSDAAREGTIAHKYGEGILLDDKSLDDIEDETMRAGVEIYTEYAEKIFNEYIDPGYEVEGRVVLEQLIPGGSPSYWSCFGSADFFIYENAEVCDMPEGHKTLIPEVVDFKYGRHAVDADHNIQLMLYAIGLADDIGHVGRVKLTIVQPRAHHVDGPVRSWTVTGKQLRDLKMRVRRVLADASKSKKVAGDHCFYCPLAPTCEVKNAEVQQLASIEFSKDDFKPMIPESMSDHQIALIVKYHKDFIKWFNSVVEHACKESRGGHAIDGTKLVRNAGRNGWKNDKAFTKMLKELNIQEDVAYKQTPCGINDIKKLLKEMYEDNPDDLLENYIAKSEGKIVLVSEDDSRPAYNSAALDFAGK